MSEEHIENISCKKCGHWASACVCDSESSFVPAPGSANDGKIKTLVRLIAQAQLLADELGMDRDVTANLALAKMAATPLIDVSRDSSGSLK